MLDRRRLFPPTAALLLIAAVVSRRADAGSLAEAPAAAAQASPVAAPVQALPLLSHIDLFLSLPAERGLSNLLSAARLAPGQTPTAEANSARLVLSFLHEPQRLKALRTQLPLPPDFAPRLDKLQAAAAALPELAKGHAAAGQPELSRLLDEVDKQVGGFITTGQYDLAAGRLETMFSGAGRGAAVLVMEGKGLGPRPMKTAALAPRAETKAVASLESDPKQLKAAVKIIKNYDRYKQSGRLAVVKQALDFLGGYLEANRYSPEVKELAFEDAELRRTLLGIEVEYQRSGPEGLPWAYDAQPRRASMAKGGEVPGSNPPLPSNEDQRRSFSLPISTLDSIVDAKAVTEWRKAADAVTQRRKELVFAAALGASAVAALCYAVIHHKDPEFMIAIILLYGFGAFTVSAAPFVWHFMDGLQRSFDYSYSKTLAQLGEAGKTYLVEYRRRNALEAERRALMKEYRRDMMRFAEHERRALAQLSELYGMPVEPDRTLLDPSAAFEDGIAELLQRPGPERAAAESLLRRRLVLDAARARASLAPEDFKRLAALASLLTGVIPHGAGKDPRQGIAAELTAVLRDARFETTPEFLHALSLQVEALPQLPSPSGAPLLE